MTPGMRYRRDGRRDTDTTGPYDPDERTHLHVEADEPAGEAETVPETGRVARWTR